jgi:hypothetical protein
MSDDEKNALAELRAHVQVCDVRYQNIEAAMTRMSSAIERLGGRFNSATFALIGGLFAVIAYFIVKHGV